MEKCGRFRKNGCFSGRIWPDWGNTTRADMAGLGSIGFNTKIEIINVFEYSWKSELYHSMCVVASRNFICNNFPEYEKMHSVNICHNNGISYSH